MGYEGQRTNEEQATAKSTATHTERSLFTVLFLRLSVYCIAFEV